MRNDGVTIADHLPLVDHIGQLPARCRSRVKNVLVFERHSVEPQERKHLEAIAVIVGDAEQLGVGIEGDHRILHGTDGET
jgi:hypothetical protein